MSRNIPPAKEYASNRAVRLKPGPSKDQKTDPGSSKQVILITYATFGHAYTLAQKYLSNGHVVIIHYTDDDFEERFKRWERVYTRNNCRLVWCPLDDVKICGIIEAALKYYGRVDTVFHFASAICKPGSTDEDESLEYLFEANVKPFVYIAKHLMLLQKKKSTTRMLAIAPIIPRDAIQNKLHAHIDAFTNYLRATVDQLDEVSGENLKILSRLVDMNDFDEVNFEAPNVTNEVYKRLVQIESRMIE